MKPDAANKAATAQLPVAADRQLDKTRHMLARWAAFAEDYWYDLPQRPDLGCFGTGYNSWGVQTNQKYIGTVGILALDPGSQQAITQAGLTTQHLLNRALAALRYEIATHLVGDVKRTDGSQWGHTWISGLGVERMMHAVDALWPAMTDDDRRGFLNVLASEADWLLAEWHVGASPWAQEIGRAHV